jgi:hypothetical protein
MLVGYAFFSGIAKWCDEKEKGGARQRIDISQGAGMK